MAFGLAEAAERTGYRIASFESIGSTSTEALDRARAGEPGPLWIVARHQNAGRGRRGNAWSTARGNLAASLLAVIDAPPATIATLGFVAGVALVEALCVLRDAPLRVAPQHDEVGARSSLRHAEEGRRPVSKHAPTFALKWPNDLLVDGAKLAGILLETEKRPDGRYAVVVGIGVNVADAPQDLPYRTTSLAELGIAAAPEALFAALSAAWIDAFALWDEGRGFAAVRRLWLAHAGGIGQPIRIRLPREELSGTFETIDDSGRLILRGDEGRLAAISAGEVHFPGAAAA